MGSDLTAVDVAIIGGGPAGLTAALYAGRARLSVKVIEEMGIGGQVFTTSVVENYPGLGVTDGPTIAQKMEEQAREWGAEIVLGRVTRIEGSPEAGFTLQLEGQQPLAAKTVIVASGSHPRKLGVPGEKEFLGRGVSYCATCDGAFFKDKRVVVVGGGDSALEEGHFLTHFAREVLVVHRRDQFRASRYLVERAERAGMKFVLDSVVEEIKGERSVNEVVVRNVKTGEIRTIPADGVFIYIGMIPNTEFLSGLVELDEWGFVVAGEDCCTSVPGIYAAGDVRQKPLRQIVTAVADGAVAAMQAERFLTARK